MAEFFIIRLNHVHRGFNRTVRINNPFFQDIGCNSVIDQRSSRLVFLIQEPHETDEIIFGPTGGHSLVVDLFKMPGLFE